MNIKTIKNYSFNPELKSRRLGEVLMVYNPDTGETLELNDTGAEIFEFLSQQKDVEQILRTLTEEYDAEEDNIVEDVAAFIERMILQGVIELNEG